MESFKKLWIILDTKNKLFFFGIIFLFLIQALLEIISLASIIPFVTALLNPDSLKDIAYFKYFEKLISTKNLANQFPLFTFLFFLFFLIKSITLILIYKIISKFVYKLQKTISLKILKKYLHQNYLYFIKNPFSKLTTNINNEVRNFIVNFVRALLILLSELIIFFSIILLVILSGNIKVILFFLPIVVLVFLIIKYLNKNIKKWTQDRVFNERLANNNFFQIILGIKEVILIGKIKKLLNNFEKVYENLAEITIKQSVIQTIPRPILEVLAIGAFLLFLLYSYYQGVSDKEIIVILSFYLAIAYRLLPSMNKIFVNYQQIKFGKVSLNIIYDDTKIENKLIYEIESKNKLDFNKNIKLNNISFGFNEGKNIFSKINFTLCKNEIIGIFGESGSGKSTFLNIFCSLIEPNSGKILLDEKEILNKQIIRKYQNLISFISQDTFLLDDTIKNNILFGSDKIFDQKDLENALEFSKVNNFLKELPNGIDTIIGTNSKKISSGQKQRIAIARLIYNARKILIFDEATNALDEDNEKEIINNIMNLKNKNTVIIVSHNKNNLKLCDKIYEIKNGSVILK